MTIPFLLHQIGPTEDVPDHLRGFCESWQFWNPSLQRMFWTDVSLRAFIAEQAPAFLAIFDAFPNGACRADLGRYLLMQHFGGIYADLDCQCLQPIAPLLEGRRLLLSTEPESHLQQAACQQRGLSQIVCPSFLASEPGHPLWRDVLSALSGIDASRVLSCDDVLDATGPFLLSRVFAANPAAQASLFPSPRIYPFSKDDCWQGRVFDPVFWSERTRDAFVAHYWDGSWFRASEHWRASVPSLAPVNVQAPVWPVVLPGVVSRKTGSADRLPLISCLMVTRGRPRQAALAIDCFLAQTYEAKELIIVDDDPCSQLAGVIAATGSSLIRHVRLPDRGQTLGALRNVALEYALGDYICQWDDDDLYDPVRLEVQWQTLGPCGAQASVLARWMIWWPHARRLALSCYRDWEGSLMCERSVMPRYPEWTRGEDSDVLERLRQTIRLVRIDLPRLCVYIAHGLNTFESDHFDLHWRQASFRWQGAESERLEQELDRRVPLLRYREALCSRPVPVTLRQEGIAVSDMPGRPRDPAVLILTPVRHGCSFLARYAELVDNLEYDHSRLSLSLMEGDGDDATFSVLDGLRSRWEARFRRVALHRHGCSPPLTPAERGQPAVQLDRPERLAQLRHHLLMAALQDEDWVLWLDMDVCDYPSDLLHRLLSAGRDIVTANCLGPTEAPFDLNSFRIRRDVEAEPGRVADPLDPVSAPQAHHVVDGLCQHPPGHGREYVDAFRAQPLVELDSVGSTVLLVRADLHRQGLQFPAYPMGGLIETEPFSSAARALGVRSWALPQLLVRHA